MPARQSSRGPPPERPRAGIDSCCVYRSPIPAEPAAADDLPDLDIELKQSAGSLTNVARVATGKADYTIAAADAVEHRLAELDQAYQRGGMTPEGAKIMLGDLTGWDLDKGAPNNPIVMAMNTKCHRRLTEGFSYTPGVSEDEFEKIAPT